MNKKNGFSLIEILAIIVVVGIISGIAIPNIKRISEKEEDEKQNSLNKKIENAAHLYVAKFKASDLVENNTIKITLNNLVESGLLELKDGEISSIDNESRNVLTSKIIIRFVVTNGTNRTIKYNYCYKNENADVECNNP